MVRFIRWGIVNWRDWKFKNKIMKKLLLILLIISHLATAQDGTIFDPVTPQKQIEGLKITENLMINGRLEEDAWKLAPVAKGFFKQ